MMRSGHGRKGNTMETRTSDAGTILGLAVYLDGRHVARKIVAMSDHVTVGRNPCTDVRLRHPEVSRIHAVIHRRLHGFEIHDRSSNGLRVNGRLVETSAVRDGDIVAIGPFVLVVELYGSREAAAAAAATPADSIEDDAETLNAASRT